jgi:hypothetical protein
MHIKHVYDAIVGEDHVDAQTSTSFIPPMRKIIMVGSDDRKTAENSIAIDTLPPSTGFANPIVKTEIFGKKLCLMLFSYCFSRPDNFLQRDNVGSDFS